MALTGKLLADFSDFYDAVQRADVELRGMETGASKVEASLNRMTDSFSGRKIVQDATLAAEAVNRIGGASKLTEAEQAKVNRTVTEAIAKYKALGQDAPAALVKMAADTKRVDDATESASKSATGWASTLKNAAGALGIAFSVQAVTRWVGATVDAASRVDDLSKKLGVSAEAIQRWEFAAKQSGATIDDVDKAVDFMNRTLATGDKSTVHALRLAGLEFDAIRKMKTEDAFNTIATAVAAIEDPMTRARVQYELFGRGSGALSAAISEGIVKVGKDVDVMAATTVKRLADAQDAWQRLLDKATVVSGETIGFVLKATSSWEQYGKTVQAVLNPFKMREYLAEMKAVEAEAAKMADAQTARTDEARKASVAAALAADDAAKRRAKFEQEADAARKKAQAEAEAAAKALVAIQDKLFGLDAIARAAQYVKALGDVNNISKLTAAAKIELNAVMATAYERLVLLGRGASAAAGEYRNLRDMTVDLGKFQTFLASQPDPFAEHMKKRTLAIRESLTETMIANQAITLNAEYWKHAGEMADAEMAKAAESVASVAPAAEKSAQSISNSFNNTWLGIANGAAMMASQVERTLAALAQTQAYKDAGIFVGRGFGSAEQINAAALKMPRFDTGGPVTRDGPIFAHAGEFVVPKGASMGNTYQITVHASGETEGRRAAEAMIAHLKRKGIRLN